MHDVAISLHICLIRQNVLQGRCAIRTKFMSSFETATRLISPPLAVLPKMNLAVFRIFRRDSNVCARTVGPMAISFQYSAVAAHSRNTSVPYASSFFLSWSERLAFG